jgi:hypothetical protein
MLERRHCLLPMAMGNSDWRRVESSGAPVKSLRSSSVEEKGPVDGQREHKREGKRGRPERGGGVPQLCWR